MAFIKASKKKKKLRLALEGPPGGGKTYTALAIASGLGDKVAVIDTERDSASLYSDDFEFCADDKPMQSFSPRDFINKIKEAERAGFDVIIIDSLSHAWMGKGGALEMVDNAAQRSQSKNSYMAWRDVTPEHNELVDTILQCGAHVIVTMRTKVEYVLETDAKGKQAPRKIGTKPIQRDGVEYEFDIVADVADAVLTVSKTRIDFLHQQVVRRPGKELGQKLLAWLNTGKDVPSPAPAADDSPKPEAPKAPAAPPSAPTTPAPEALLRKCKKLIDDAVTKGDLTALAGVGLKIPVHFKEHPAELAEAREYFAAAEAKLMEAPAAAADDAPKTPAEAA